MLHMHHNDLITTADAAARLGLTPRAISRLVACGDITPALRLPYGRRGAFLFAAADVAALASRRGIK